MTTTIKLIRSENGTLDVHTTLSAVEKQLHDLAYREENSEREISTAVHAVFDTHLGKTIPMPAVRALALANMGTSYEDYAEQDKAVKFFIRNSPEFKINKGKNGGVMRVYDTPSK